MVQKDELRVKPMNALPAGLQYQHGRARLHPTRAGRGDFPEPPSPHPCKAQPVVL